MWLLRQKGSGAMERTLQKRRVRSPGSECGRAGKWSSMASVDPHSCYSPSLPVGHMAGIATLQWVALPNPPSPLDPASCPHTPLVRQVFQKIRRMLVLLISGIIAEQSWSLEFKLGITFVTVRLSQQRVMARQFAQLRLLLLLLRHRFAIRLLFWHLLDRERYNHV